MIHGSDALEERQAQGWPVVILRALLKKNLLTADHQENPCELHMTRVLQASSLVWQARTQRLAWRPLTGTVPKQNTQRSSGNA